MVALKVLGQSASIAALFEDERAEVSGKKYGTIHHNNLQLQEIETFKTKKNNLNPAFVKSFD